MTLKILNLYAGIGGNRKLWDEVADVEVTAVEINEEIAEEYKRQFPGDEVIVADAHEYLKENYERFDFIWSSPPCQTHSSIRKAGARNNQYDVKYPDMKLWQEIIFLKHFCDTPWVVENVKPYYDKDVSFKKSELFIEPQQSARHYFWSSFEIPEVDVESQNINKGNCKEWRKYLRMDVKRDWTTVGERGTQERCSS